ncbi:molybdopterin-dependent oxidoreductase [Pseudonocardia humida]|uniref:Molybdopterin-dependent oxidoreductase n=1 Tax=Pseudonocardia humida TaxID=2800819 RepID=A0ABT0ZWA1_9PSEU|nr:molybdopterin-dependent oxidoreductase [Pseudonocardia humida]MCO1655022.1 molybdopterin-dependent oxidoreductase [Pseudonocardia humida]
MAHPDVHVPPMSTPLLPPGQRAVAGFPRFGSHLHRPPPPVPDRPVLLVGGEFDEPFPVDLTDLDLPTTEQVSDLHCVSGWSAVGLRWTGVGFGAFYDHVVAPRLRPGPDVTHVVLTAHDGYRVRVALADLREPDVLLATGLDGAPLTPAHGAPLRLVSPSQYGFVSVKHLRGIEARSTPPAGHRRTRSTTVAGGLVHGHRRARVWREERHPHLPAALVRPLYRLFIAPGIALGALGAHTPAA